MSGPFKIYSEEIEYLAICGGVFYFWQPAKSENRPWRGSLFG